MNSIIFASYIVLDELLRDEGFNWCFSSVTDSSVMQMRPVRMSI